MDVQAINTLIATMGFPIVAYLLMFFKMEKTIDRLEGTLQQVILELSKGAKNNG